MRHLLILSMLLATLALATGCDGGLVGTSTGPSASTTQIPRLPKKISPLLPDTIKKKTTQSSSSTSDQTTTEPTQSTVQPQTESKSWLLMSDSLQEIDTTRIAVQEILILLESELDDLIRNCFDQFLNGKECDIPAGQIEATYSDDTTSQMIAVHQTANAATPVELIIESADTTLLRSFYHSLEGSKVRFNRTSLKLPATATDNYTLTTSTDHLLAGSELQLHWNTDYDQVTYELVDAQSDSATTRYNYQNNAAGQRLTVQRELSNGGGTATSDSFELTAGTADTGEIYYNARVENYHITGQATENNAFAYNRDFADENDSYLQEVYDEEGYLLIYDECEEIAEFFCEELASLNEEIYELYISPQDIEAAYTELGFNDVTITGLPPMVEDFLILENNPDIPLWLRDEYCHGWQPVTGEVELFCFVTNEELENTVVVSADGGMLELLPDTRVVIEQYDD